MFDSLLNHASNGIIPTSLVAKLAFLLVMTQLTILSVTLYLHRSQSHRSVDFHPALAHAFRFWCWLTTAMVTREWVAIHRKHHAHCETERDPHSPQIFGIGKLIGSGTELYMAARADSDLLTRFGRGTPDDWIERHLYTPHCNWGPTVLAVLEIALFGVGGMAIWAVQMMWIPFWGAGVVNGIGHWWGYRNFETADRSTNLCPFAIWIGGEELHNNHHAFPSSAKFSVRRFEFDLGWLVIQWLEKLKLARVKRVCGAVNTRSNHRLLGDLQPPRAFLTERVRVMTGFFRDVMLPALRDESRRNLDDAPPLRLRRALANGGRWLDEDERARLNAWIATRPCLHTLCRFRAQLSLLMERCDVDAAARGLSQWVRAAMESDIDSLRTFAASLAGDTFSEPEAPDAESIIPARRSAGV
jgi:stearoyl-CoA desaturase (delta-9 desaturase)